MSAKWMGYFFDDTNLEGSELLLALAIADHADVDGIALPGVKLLAKKIRLGTRRTQGLIKQLEELGFVMVTRSAGRGKLSVFQLKKVQLTAPFTEEKRCNSLHLLPKKKDAIPGQKKVQPAAPFTEEKRCNPETIKGAIPGQKKVQSRALPLNKDEPFKEPLFKPEEKTRAREPEFDPVFDNEFLRAYKRAFPGYALSIFQQEMIVSRVRDGTAWAQALEFWAGNDYRPRSVNKICDCYDQILRGELSDKRTKQSNAGNIAAYGPYFDDLERRSGEDPPDNGGH